MKVNKMLLLIAAILALSICQVCKGNCDPSIYDTPQLIPIRKGTTYTAKQWPSQQNQWVGQMACEGCNPKDGDTACTIKLPLLCILHHKSLDRPYYSYQPDSSQYTSNKDGGFYNSWTGGVLLVTDSIQGFKIDSYATGDQICKDYYGYDAKFAQFHDGYWMDDMNGFNQGVVKAWGNWNWAVAKCGEWSLWGYFNHHWTGRAWIWINNQPNGNCGEI